MNWLAFIFAAVIGVSTGFGLEDAGISVIVSINIAIPITYGWYKLIETIRIEVE